MNREIWEFLVKGSDRVIQTWFREEIISKRDQAKLDVALNRLRSLDFQLVGPKLLAGPLRQGGKVYKLRIRCENRELRPMLCRGPMAPSEYTLLLGALEVGGAA